MVGLEINSILHLFSNVKGRLLVTKRLPLSLHLSVAHIHYLLCFILINLTKCYLWSFLNVYLTTWYWMWDCYVSSLLFHTQSSHLVFTLGSCCSQDCRQTVLVTPCGCFTARTNVQQGMLRRLLVSESHLQDFFFFATQIRFKCWGWLSFGQEGGGVWLITILAHWCLRKVQTWWSSNSSVSNFENMQLKSKSAKLFIYLFIFMMWILWALKAEWHPPSSMWQPLPVLNDCTLLSHRKKQKTRRHQHSTIQY